MSSQSVSNPDTPCQNVEWRNLIRKGIELWKTYVLFPLGCCFAAFGFADLLLGVWRAIQ